MYLRKFIILSFLFAVNISSYGQISDNRLREDCENEAQELATKLNLKSKKQRKLSKVLYKHYRDLGQNVGHITEFSKRRIELGQKKNSRIRKILGDHNYNTYLILSKLHVEDLAETSNELFLSIYVNPDYTKEFYKYHEENILPVVSKYHDKLTGEMKLKDYRILQEYQKRYFKILDSLDLQRDADRMELNKEISEDNSDLEQIHQIIKKYENNYRNVLFEMDSYSKKWSADLNRIFLEFYPESNLKSLKEINSYLAKRAIGTEIRKLQFYLMLPYDSNRYFKNLQAIYCINSNILYSQSNSIN